MSEKPVPRGRRIDVDWAKVRRRIEESQRSMGNPGEADRSMQEKILRERSAALARAVAPKEDAVPAGDVIEVLVFQSAGERYAFETRHIGQVCPISAITILPGVPDFVVGIVPYQGEVLSVIDLRSLLDLPLSGLTEPSSIIVLKGEAMEFGILAESISGIERHPADSLQNELPTLADIEKTFLKGVTLNHTAVLDAEQMLSDTRMVVEID